MRWSEGICTSDIKSFINLHTVTVSAYEFKDNHGISICTFFVGKGMSAPQVQPCNSNAASASNLWLAIGDETGTFKNPPSPWMHGAGLILARPATLVAALNENLNGQSIRRRMDGPVEGLGNWLRSKGSEKAGELKRHHVREAWEYFKEQGFKGQLPLDASHSDPVLTNLLNTFRWLAAHEDILSLGIYGSGKDVMNDFWKGSDPMAAIGAMYGRTLALVKPFLGPSAKIRVLPGFRSEEINAPPILRAGQDVPAPFPGYSRQTTNKTGGNRALLEAMESEFWKTLDTFGNRVAVPFSASSRQITFAGYMNKKAAVAALENEDMVAARLVDREEARLNNLADLACSLMVASCDSTVRDLHIQFSEPIGPNVRFLSVKEVLS